MPRDMPSDNYCQWQLDDWYGWYDTDCGEAFSVEAGSLVENKMKYCTYCGKEIKEVILREETE
jgi:hypothetical protein